MLSMSGLLERLDFLQRQVVGPEGSGKKFESIEAWCEDAKVSRAYVGRLRNRLVTAKKEGKAEPSGKADFMTRLAEAADEDPSWFISGAGNSRHGLRLVRSEPRMFPSVEPIIAALEARSDTPEGLVEMLRTDARSDRYDGDPGEQFWIKRVGEMRRMIGQLASANDILGIGEDDSRID